MQFLNDDENVQILAHSLSHGRESHGLKQVPEKLFVKYIRRSLTANCA